MDDICDLPDPRIVQAGIFRIGDHQRSGMFAYCCLQSLDVRISVFAGHQRNDLVPGSCSGPGVPRMGEHSRDDLVADFTLSPCFVVGAYNGDIGKQGLRSPGGLQRKSVKPGNLFQILTGLVVYLKNTLHCAFTLIGVELRHFGAAHKLLVDLWTVLHRAGTEPDINIEIGSDRLL